MLTEHQQRVLADAKDILTLENRLLIKGSAGVGKTFMVKVLIEQLGIDHWSTICSAPTHKAVAVIREKVGMSVSFTTIHSALKMKRRIDHKGDWSFKPSFSPNYPPLQNIKYLIIDEASMISQELLAYIEEFASKEKVTVIFLGDSKQLNPVDEEDSPVFQAEYPTVELTEIVRQGAGNPIIELSRNLKAINSNINNLIDEKGFVYTRNKGKIIEELARVNGTDEFKYLSYTNQDVNAMNKLVRKAIYGDPAKIEKGETMVFNAPYGEDYSTNEEILVETVQVLEEEYLYKRTSMSDTQWKREGAKEEDNPYQKVKLKVYLINETIPVIHEDSEAKLKEVSSELRSNCKAKLLDWPEFYNFVEQFADLKYNHALTIHKSQGSTYKQAVINLTNINFNRKAKEKERLLYTAVTRASDLLIIYQST